MDAVNSFSHKLVSAVFLHIELISRYIDILVKMRWRCILLYLDQELQLHHYQRLHG